MIANQPQQKLFSELWYSFRRFVDSFFLRNISVFEDHSKILDIGGKKINKRGIFDIGKYPLTVEYANVASDTQPDYLCDVTQIPVEDASYQGVILAEVLEHVPDPIRVLQEAHRVLKQGGYLLATTPFMFRVHADPYNYLRYTDYWYYQTLEKLDFKDIQVYKQGSFPSVCGDLLKVWAYELHKADKPTSRCKRKVLHWLIYRGIKLAFTLEQHSFFKDNPSLSSHTTGYGVIGRK